jgi:hypothetical protein
MNIELKPIAESKVRQLGGDVCGVLVRNEAGAWAAVSEGGRVMWLDDFEGQPASAQGGRGAEASDTEKLRCQQCGNMEPFHATGCKTEFGSYSGAAPQPAQQGSIPDGWRLTHIDDPETDGYIIRGPGISYCAWKDKEPWLYLFCEALATTPQPEGDAVAVPVAALEYLKDQWPGAYAKLYERICSNNLPQPQKEDA